MLIRPATPEDGAVLSEIYRPYVLDTEITFETVPPTAEQFAERIRKTMERYPYVVCEEDGLIVGYCYASRHGERAAYEYSASMSVYVRQGWHRKGVARAMYEVVLPELKKRGFKLATALISMPNEASAAFHASFGFTRVGVFHSMGWKHGKWLDQLLLEKQLDVPGGADRVRFTKMQGCGNDYIFIDCMGGQPMDTTVIPKLCDRHFGVGGDGVVYVCPSDIADAKMLMYNSDGSEGLMCGNALRCVVKLLIDYGYAGMGSISIETKSGVKTVETAERSGACMLIRADVGKVEVTKDMTDAEGRPAVFVSVGNPHVVEFCNEPDELPLGVLGPVCEHDPRFEDGVNVEFVRVVDRTTLKMRVWERGSGETLACGTGACAAACAAVECGFCDAGVPITVQARGGELTVLPDGDSVYLTGDAVTVFEGEALI